MLGLIHRTIRYKNRKVLVSLYKSIVRLHLENCSVVWSPHYTKDKALLQRVQHQFTRMFPDLRKMPYDEQLQKLGLWSLEERCCRTDLIEIFKNNKGFTAGCGQLDTRSTRHVCRVDSFTKKSTRHKSTRHRSQLDTRSTRYNSTHTST